MIDCAIYPFHKQSGKFHSLIWKGKLKKKKKLSNNISSPFEMKGSCLPFNLSKDAKKKQKKLSSKSVELNEDSLLDS